MKNLLNIEDKVKIIMPGYDADGKIAEVTEMQKMSGEIYYTGIYHVNCPDGGEGYDQTVQFKKGQYEALSQGTIKPCVNEQNPNNKVRCKFRVTEKTQYEKNDQCERPTKVKLFPVQSEPFGKYTPSGSMELYIQNDEAEKMLKVGTEYYVDLTPVE